jgi:AcrR family transcriptional regulator
VDVGVGRLGSKRVGAERIAGVQRARMVSAMVDVSCELGAGSVSVADVVDRSGVSRRTFYEIFADKDDCLLASFEHALAVATERVLQDYDPGAGWVERIRHGLVGFLSFLDEEPRLGRMLMVESTAAGASVTRRRVEAIAALPGIVDQGRAQSKTGGAGLPGLTGEGIAGLVSPALPSSTLACRPRRSSTD